VTVHPLKEEDLKRHPVVEDKPKARYSYTAGQALSVFLNGLKEGKILGRKCTKCGRIYVPPRMYCEDCFVENGEYVEAKGPYLDTFTIIYEDDEGRRLEKPLVIGLIRFRGCSGGLLGSVEGELKAGSEVEIMEYGIPLRVKTK